MSIGSIMGSMASAYVAGLPSVSTEQGKVSVSVDAGDAAATSGPFGRERAALAAGVDEAGATPALREATRLVDEGAVLGSMARALFSTPAAPEVQVSRNDDGSVGARVEHPLGTGLIGRSAAAADAGVAELQRQAREQGGGELSKDARPAAGPDKAGRPDAPGPDSPQSRRNGSMPDTEGSDRAANDGKAGPAGRDDGPPVQADPTDERPAPGTRAPDVAPPAPTDEQAVYEQLMAYRQSAIAAQGVPVVTDVPG